MHMIGMAENGLDMLDKLIPAVRDLGRRHVFYGVTQEHYSSVGRALIWTLEQGLGADFTPKVKEAWTTVYCRSGTQLLGKEVGTPPVSYVVVISLYGLPYHPEEIRINSKHR